LVLGAASLLYWLIYRTAEMLSMKYVERTNVMAMPWRAATVPAWREHITKQSAAEMLSKKKSICRSDAIPSIKKPC